MVICGIVEQILPTIRFERNEGSNLAAYLGYKVYIETKRRVITNFHTKFPGKDNKKRSWSTFMTAQEIFENCNNPKYNGALFVINNISGIINQSERGALEWLINQLSMGRMNRCDFIWDSQYFINVHKSLRDYTDFIYTATKHACIYDSVKKEHILTKQYVLNSRESDFKLFVYQEYPELPPENRILPSMQCNSWEIEGFYDINEKNDQTIGIPTKKRM